MGRGPDDVRADLQQLFVRGDERATESGDLERFDLEVESLAEQLVASAQLARRAGEISRSLEGSEK